MSSITSYTRTVSIAKRFLLLLAVLMIGLVVWIATYNSDEGGARLAMTPAKKSNDAQPVMLKPHYQGVDARNRPFTVIADKGTQVDKDNVLLDHVQADMTMESGAWVALKSGTGHMYTPTKHLLLTGGVDLFYEGGYEFRTDHAEVDVPKGAASGDSPIEGQGPTGTLKAKTFSAADHGQVLHFNGSVIMTIYR